MFTFKTKTNDNKIIIVNAANKEAAVKKLSKNHQVTTTTDKVVEVTNTK